MRDAEAAAAQAVVQQAARQKQRTAEIAGELEAEDRVYRRKVAKQEFDRQVRLFRILTLLHHAGNASGHFMPCSDFCGTQAAASRHPHAYTDTTPTPSNNYFARTSTHSLEHCITQVEENYQRQMGITAAQQRTDAYMRTHTLTHQAILNPTSRVPVYPSEAVLVKPVGFGLGRSSLEAVRKVAAKHGARAVDLQDCPLLPSQYRWGFACAGVAFKDEPCWMTQFQM